MSTGDIDERSGEFAELVERYNGASEIEREAILGEIEAVAPGVLEYGRFGTPSGLDWERVDAQLRLSTGALGPLAVWCG